MTRLTHIILLLLSLAVIVRIGLSGPGSFSGEADIVDQGKVQGEVPGEMVFNPEAPAPLPDLIEGYIFSEARVLDESDFNAFNRSGKKEPVSPVSTVDFEQVYYSGSIIIGDMRRALVTYPAVKSTGKKGGRGGPAMKHEQLDQGDEFMGFLVASVESDRIVFEKDGEKVEKFLHDQGKNRVVVKGRVRASDRKASKPKGARAPGATRNAPGARGERSRNRNSKQQAAATVRSRPKPPKDLPQRRSQRLLRSDLARMLPPSQGGKPPLGTSASH